MSKKNKKIKTVVDFDIGVGEVIPATQEAFSDQNSSVLVRKQEKTGLASFKEVFSREIDTKLRDNTAFPTDDEVFVFIPLRRKPRA